MTLIQCSTCRMNTLGRHGKCQYCGAPLKVSIWHRKMRKREAYAILLIVLSLGLIQLYKLAGVALLFAGIGLIVVGLFKPRVR